MTKANALGFLALGSVMVLLPTLCPGLFPHTAVDGSSTRALWTGTMGAVQLVIAIATLGGGWIAALRTSGKSLLAARGTLATAEWATDDVVSAVRISTAPTFASLAAGDLDREHAALWRAFVQTLHEHGASAAAPVVAAARVIERNRRATPQAVLEHLVRSQVIDRSARGLHVLHQFADKVAVSVRPQPAFHHAAA
jgi:hypothetical protein